MVRGPVAARSTSDEASASVLGRGARVRGRVTGQGDLRVEGQIEGDVSVSGELVIDEGGSVTGEVGAGSVVIGGTLRGDVTARGIVTVRATAQVEGDLGGAEVSLEEGASFRGRIYAEFELPAELLDGGSHPQAAGPQTPGQRRGR
jgi:cytoskeletal protein CcmA (bactofilin family)